MCEKRKHNRIDKCIYPMTVITKYRYRGKPGYVELFSDITIPRSRNFYKKDKQGFYYIPETIKI